MCRLLILVGLFLSVSIGRSIVADDRQAAEEFFQQQIAPILISHCLECHSDAGKGGLDLRSGQSSIAGGESGPAIEPGEPENSLLYEYVASGEMPPKESLTEDQISAIEKWIRDGAYFPEDPIDPFAVTTDRRAGFDWWSLQPLVPVDLPEAPEPWQENPIDRFIHSGLVKAGISPSLPADPRTLIRRATYDLIGLPPTPGRVSEFISASEQETGKQNQVGPKVYQQLIDELLLSPHYGEHWGRHWLDVVRFGESNGFERNIIHETVWPFRDYVIRSFNEDKPFNRFILEHLAGDTLGADDPEVAIGTAFLVCGPYDNVGNQDKNAAAQIRADAIDEMIRATSEAFLGMTIGCSRCHDHKFDPISQKDYYALYATFAGVQHGERTLHSNALKWWVGNFQQEDGPFHVFLGGSPQRKGDQITPASLAMLDRTSAHYELETSAPEQLRRLKLAESIIVDDNPITPRVLSNRLWHYHFGTGIVNTPSDLGFLGGQPSHPELLDWLAIELKQADWRLKPIHRQIMLSQTYQQASHYRVEAAKIDGNSRLLWRFPPRRLSGEEIRDTTLAVTGNLDRRMGGLGFRLFRYVQDNVATYHPLDQHGTETYRRAVYHHNARAMQIDLMSEFDTPDCAFSTPRRSSTTTPLQALTLMNHSFSTDMAKAFAKRIEQESNDRDGQIERAFQLAFLRDPSGEESTAARSLIDSHGTKALCRALLNSNEFIHVD